MLCEAVCDADRPNQLSETIGNLGFRGWILRKYHQMEFWF